MKNFFIVILILICGTINAQDSIISSSDENDLNISSSVNSIFFEYGKSTSNIDFRTSSGTLLNYLYPISNNYLRVGYNLNSNTNYYTSFSLGYNTYGSVGSDMSINDLYKWDLDYLGVNIDGNIILFKYRDLSLHLSAGFSLDYMTRGLQTINNQVFKIRNEGEFNPYAFFFKSGLAISHPVSKFLNINLQYRFIHSFEMNNDVSLSRMFIENHSFGIGFNFKI